MSVGGGQTATLLQDGMGAATKHQGLLGLASINLDAEW